MTDQAPLWQRVGMSAACSYELVALWSKRLPTGTRIVHEHPWVAVPVLVGLAIHFIPPKARWW